VRGKVVAGYFYYKRLRKPNARKAGQHAG